MSSSRGEVGIRSSRRFNPITGEELVFSARPPSRPNSRPDCVPPLPLNRAYGKEREEMRYRPRSRRDGSPESATSTVSWGSETGRSDVSVMQLDSMRNDTIRPQGVPPLQVQANATPRNDHDRNGRGPNKDWDEPHSTRSNVSTTRHGKHTMDSPRDEHPPAGKNADWTEISVNRQVSSRRDKMMDDIDDFDDDYDDRSTIRSPSECSASDIYDHRPPVGKPDKLDNNYDSLPSSRRYSGRGDDTESCLSYRSTRSDASSIRSERRLAMDENTRQLVRLWEYKTGERTKKAFRRGIEREERSEANRHQHTLETVMIDQLSRAPLCDPEQSADRHMKESALRHTPGMGRGKIRALHESKIRTSSSQTEQLLSDRIRFNARILTGDGRDALRELCGFYFDVDKTFTVYEYRQLGKTSKALPLLHRSTYSCVWGTRRDEGYSILDLYPGNTLYIDVKMAKSLPKTLQAKKALAVRITDVDVEAKRAIMMAQFLGRRGQEQQRWSELLPQLHLSKLKEDDIQMQLALLEIHESIRSQLGRRGCPVAGGLFAFYRRRCNQESDAEYELPRWTLEEGLRKYRVPLTDEDLDIIWEYIDPHGEGYVDFVSYIRAALGEMNEPRREMVLKSYLKMDVNKRGWITFADVGKFHKSGHNPTKLHQFLEAFDFVATKDVITYTEYEIFYEGVSIELPDDNDFMNELLQSWNL